MKVEAGELDAHRAQVRAKQAARREIAPMVEAARVIYMLIGQEYDDAYKANVKSWNRETCTHDVPIPKALHRAQDLNNAIFYGTQVKGGREPGLTGILSDVKSGARRDYLEARQAVIDHTHALEELVAAWNAYKAGL